MYMLLLNLNGLRFQAAQKKQIIMIHNFLKKEGFCIKPNLYSRELLSSIREQYHGVHEKPEKWVWTSKNVRKNLRAPQKTIPDFRHFINDDVSRNYKKLLGPILKLPLSGYGESYPPLIQIMIKVNYIQIHGTKMNTKLQV